MSSARAVVTLPSDTEIQIVREFAAPKHLVYRAWTTPELIRRWWGAGRGEVTSVEVDLSVGGGWRYVMVAEGGFEVGFHGQYRELVPNERMVSTEVFEGMPDAESLNTLTLTEVDGRTTMTVLVKHETKANRDAHVESGMEEGMNESLNAFEQVVAELS